VRLCARAARNVLRDNEASLSLMERVGMRRELHAVRESLHRSGQWLDTVGYAIFKDEWGAQRVRLAEASRT
jgi:RimJ/RimL family protein N-acetyltransferase